MRILHFVDGRSSWRTSWSSGRILFLIGISGTATLGLIVLAALWAGTESDLAALDRQRQLVNARLREQVDQVAKDIDQIAIGFASLNALASLADDATSAAAPGSDHLKALNSSAATTAISIATSVFGYDHAFVVDGAETLLVHGDAEMERRYKWMRPLFKPLLLQARLATDGSRKADREGPAAVISGDAPPARNASAQLMRVQGRPTIVGIVAMHQERRALQQSRVDASELSYLIAIRFLDGAALDELSREQGLNGARFARAADQEGKEVAFQINATETEDPIGFIIWNPDLPGSRVVGRLVPTLSFAGLVIAVLFSLLLVWLRNSLNDLRTSEHQARHLAMHDVLTGLPNRAFFAARLEACLADPATLPRRAALVLIDLDRFKIVNDTHGHAAGDELIRLAADRMRAVLKPPDVLARLGGDEFALLMENIGAADVLITGVMEDMLARLSEPFLLLDGEVSVHIGASMGLAIPVDAGTEASDLMRLADVALYEAKSAGRGRWVKFNPCMDQKRNEREVLKNELRAALNDSEAGPGLPQHEASAAQPLPASGVMELHFQPIHRAADGVLSGAEALIRWRHGEHGLLPPDRFITLAEETGLIDALGLWVLRKACQTAAGWPPELFMAVNVSPAQLRKLSFAEDVLAIVAETGLSPTRLELELTESALIYDDETTEKTLSRLRAEGIKIALDDFGTGFSSLSHLIRFGIDRIKIDRSFVALLGSKANGAAVVAAVVSLARSLGLATTAEGVETEAQREFLRAVGCGDLQGYSFAMPMPPDEIDNYISPAGAASEAAA